MASSHAARSSSMAPPSTSQKRKRRRRASSVFPADPQARPIREASVRPADDELALAKAAAMKLLDNSSGPLPDLNLHGPISLVDLRTHHRELSPRPPKKIRFQDSHTGPSGLSSINASSPETQSNGVASDRESQSKPGKVKKCVPGSSLLRQCIDPRRNPQEKLSPDSYEDNGQVFVVKGSEIFAENAILDAFQASLNEFHFYHHDRGTCDGASCGVVAMTESERRSASSLYYGTPPPTPRPGKNKSSHRPKLAPFIPPARTSSDATLIQASAPRQASPISSDLDMEEYIEMFGDLTTPAISQPVEEERVIENEGTGSRGTEKHGLAIITDLDHANPAEREEQEMSISSNTSSSSLPAQFLESTLSTTTTSSTIITPVSQTQLITHALPATSSPTLSQPQTNLLLSNALNAQYWAGYYTAMYHQSLGISLPAASSPAEGASASSLPCPIDSIDKTGWEAGKKAGSRNLLNPS